MSCNMIPFDPAPMISYKRFIVTMVLYRTVSEIKRRFPSKIANFSYLPCI